MTQLCYFAKVCDHELNKKHIGALQLCVHELGLTIFCEKCTKFVSRCSGLLLENREKY